jgi:hypothetical protein
MSYRVIRASELGEYRYCRRAWWLHQVCKIQPANLAAIAAGTGYHRQHGRRLRRATFVRRVAFGLLFVAIALAAFWLVGQL